MKKKNNKKELYASEKIKIEVGKLYAPAVAFLYGEDYVRRNSIWIEWDFERKLKRMTANDWERLTKIYIKALKEGENND